MMVKETTLYYFSPTGGTKKIGEGFCAAFAETVGTVDLGAKNAAAVQPVGEVVVFAAPVFGGRIPTVVTERMKELKGAGRKAVTLVVYGTRAYDDALPELNHAAEKCGFEILASAALVAQHSIVPIVGQGRPDAKDAEEIREFAERVLRKWEGGELGKIEVPGNFPYKEHMVVPATPVSTSACNKCGACEAVCPTGAVHVDENGTATELEKCILCMACVAHCPQKGRILPPPMQQGMNEKLGVLKDIRRENEFFL